METELFIITHVVREELPVEGYRKLSFVIAKQGAALIGPYYVGFGTHRSFSVDDLRKKIEADSLIAVEKNLVITRDNGVWMDTTGAVFIGDKRDPFASSLEKVHG